LQIAQPESIPVEKLPKRLVAVVKQRFPNGKIVQAERPPSTPMDEGGSMWLTLKDGKKEIQVGVSCANAFYQINTISRKIAPAELPKFVSEVVQSKYPRATVESAREVQDGLMGRARKSPMPADYYLRIKTGNDDELDLWLTPAFRRDADGNPEPDPGKVRIESESPVKEAEAKKP
jgi:hypothetical protein